MNQASNDTRAAPADMRKLTKLDWLLVSTEFVVGGIVAYFGLLQANLPLGYPAVVGLTPLCALASALACAYTWQFEIMRNARALLQLQLLGVYAAVAVASVAIGIRIGGQSLVGLMAHGESPSSQLEVVFPWVWVLGGAVGAAYLQIWTLLRYFLSRHMREHGVGVDCS